MTGAQQDSGAVGVPSRAARSPSISMRDWVPACAGGEAGYTAPDPLHPEILFGGTVDALQRRSPARRRTSRPSAAMTEPARHTWTLPLVFSQADPRALYFGNQFLFKTTDGGEHWTQISPDLTREDPGRAAEPRRGDRGRRARAGKRRGVIYTIAPSPLQAPRRLGRAPTTG